MMSDAIRAVILGIVEGVTEFLPVSSTGHMLLVKRFFGLGEGAFWDSFVVLIQLGAILAIVVIYFAKLWRIALGMFSNADDRRFVIGVLVAFLPAAVIGAAAGSYIKIYLFNPWVVCFSLIVGGAILLWVDQLDHDPHEHDATTFPLPMCHAPAPASWLRCCSAPTSARRPSFRSSSRSRPWSARSPMISTRTAPR
jgi:undecaprenyl-diphosphatase